MILIVGIDIINIDQ